LFSIKEFNILVAIIQSLMQAKWLTPTWEYVPQRHLQTYQQLHTLINPKSLREREKSDDINIPTIPYLGMSSMHSLLRLVVVRLVVVVVRLVVVTRRLF
jgi:hypothetical protein